MLNSSRYDNDSANIDSFILNNIDSAVNDS
jgi:hypothetical protein